MMTIKNFLFVAALLSLALASGCAKGGSGPCVTNCASVTVDDNGIAVAGLNLPIPMTATVTGTTQTAVTWSIQPASCGSACGTLTNVTGNSVTYVAPSAVPSNPSISVQATLQSDSSVSGSQPLMIVPITTDVAPPTSAVGVGLTQQFTAVALPDQAPQQFTWSCKANGMPCKNFTQAPGGAGIAFYTPVAAEQCGTNCVQISAFASSDPTGSGCSYDPKKFPCTIGQATVVTSRVSGTYAFQFSGFDNNGKPVSAAGTFTAGTNGVISSGVEDELTSSGPGTSIPITGGTYTPTSSDPNNSNNAGTLTLTLPAGVYPNRFQVVLDASGDIQMIESDLHGSGSGVAKASKSFVSSARTFAFGFTGADSGGNRVGCAGLLPTDGAGNINGGLMDVNDNGNTSNVCGTSPCNIAGSYFSDPSISGLWHLTLRSGTTQHFDFFVANGGTTANNPLTLYAISTDNNPAVSGTMVLQGTSPAKSGVWDNSALNGTSVSTLTGANANVALILGMTDGSSSGTGVTGACPGSGTGGFSGSFDQNNAGIMLDIGTFPGASQSPSPYTYVATNGNTGRYIVCMLGNPDATPSPVLPIPFVLYASGANRGFLLDQSSSAVMTGTMNPQQGPKLTGGVFASSAMTGTYAVATHSCSANGSTVCNSSSLAPLTMNLLLTSPGNRVYNVAGTQYPGSAGNVTGTYNVAFTGIGTIGLTAPATADYIFYAVGQTDFYMIIDASKDKNVSSPILFMAQ